MRLVDGVTKCMECGRNYPDDQIYVVRSKSGDKYELCQDCANKAIDERSYDMESCLPKDW